MPTLPVAPTARTRAVAAHRLLVVTVLGFASGLPLALTGQALQAWLSVEGIDIATIGFLSLVGLPYTFKFLWAPLMDRFELMPQLGRRRGWLVVTQLALAATLLLLAATPPKQSLQTFALLALAVAFVSASQDVVIDAYRTDLLSAAERGLGSSLNVLGYRLAMIVSGGVALIWTDPSQGGGWTWGEVYRTMAWLMVGAAAFSLLALPRLAPLQEGPRAVARNDVIGFIAVLAAVGLGYLLTREYGGAIARTLLSPWLARSTLNANLQARWVDLATLLLGIAFTLPLAAFAARKAHFETLLSGLSNYFALPGAVGFLVFIVLYKLGDAFAGSLMTPFLLQAMAYSSAEVGVVNKIIGLWLTIGGALLGGALMLKLGLVPRADAVRRAADGEQRRLLVAGHRGQGPAAGPDDPGVQPRLRRTRAGHASRRRPADGDRGREHLRRHGHRGIRRVADGVVQPALHRHAVRTAERVRVGRPRVGRAAGRRAGRSHRLADVLRRLHGAGGAGFGHAVVDARADARARAAAANRCRRRLSTARGAAAPA